MIASMGTGDLALSQYLTWLSAGASPATCDKRRRQLQVYCRDLDPLTSTESQIAGWLAAHQWGPNTRCSVRAALRGFHRWLFRHDYRADDPTAWLPPVHVPDLLPHPAPERAIHEARERSQREDVRLMIDLAACAGLRRAEIATLRFDDVTSDNDGPVLRVVGKGGRERAVPVSEDLAARILARRRPTEWVFTGRTEAGHICPDRVGVLLSDILGGGVTGHALRHRYATVVYDSTGDLLALKELLGHSKATSTQIYTKVHGRRLRAAASAASS